MRTLLAASLAITGLGLPNALRAQMDHARMGQGEMGAPKLEFGVDVGIVYSKPSGGQSTFQVGTPVDVRIGLGPAGRMMIEPRFTFTIVSGGGTFIVLDPGVNVLFRLGSGHGMHNMMGPYVTVGADVSYLSFKVSGGSSTSGAIVGFNGGIGSRMPFGMMGATRFEAFVGYQLENTDLGSPNTVNVGARIGLSLFHH